MAEDTIAAEPSAREDAIASLAGQIRHAGTGTLARLRRFDPINKSQSAHFESERMLMAAGLQPNDPQRRLRWTLVLHCLALAQGRHDVRFDAEPGAVLARLRVTEARLRQLVEADERLLALLIPRLARRLAAAGATVNWWPLAELLLFVGRDDAVSRARIESARQRLIRRYLDAQIASRPSEVADPTAL